MFNYVVEVFMGREKKAEPTTLPMIMYLNEVKDGTISDDLDVQRMFCSDNSFVNGIGVTILTEDHLPEIILCDVVNDNGTKQTYIADGGQRTAALMKIRFGNYKFTSSTEDSEIEYQAKVCDENGRVCKDEDGRILWENRVFNIKNKTFADFPKELQDDFDKFQVHVITHPNCTMERANKYVRRYNNHKSMNTSQRALTYLSRYSRLAKNISRDTFFQSCMKPSATERKNGTYEKLVCESVMGIFHLDKWKKSPKAMDAYLNENSNCEEFGTVKQYCCDLEAVCGEKYQDLFVAKNVAVWITVFDKFKKLNLPDECFINFLDRFKSCLHSTEINKFHTSWDKLDSKSGTKDKSVITTKIDLLTYLMFDFFKIDDDVLENINNEIDILEFVRENVDSNVSQDDIDDYYSMLDEYDIDKTSRLLEWQNEPSLVAMIAYSFKNDIDLDDWIRDYFRNTNMFFINQKKNYVHMKNDLSEYLQRNKKLAV